MGCGKNCISNTKWFGNSYRNSFCDYKFYFKIIYVILNYLYNLLSKRRRLMPTTGEKPGVGTYECTNCGTRVTLDDPDDTLPPCPSCDKTDFEKVS
ncbi:MAG: hypothetical protein ACFFDN_47605 [Candidatus Hodarchaeota archaeon]